MLLMSRKMTLFDEKRPHLIVVAFMICSTASLAFAQYHNEYRMVGHQGGDYGGGASGGKDHYGAGYGGGEDRPRVQLGIRLRIPAFKFELPRFSLPKITVSAKIKQPDRPRTITLPEINLDTSSKLAPPDKSNGMNYHPNGHNYGNSYSSSQYQPSYDSGQSEDKTISFSAGEDDSSGGRYYATSNNGNNNYRQNYGNNNQQTQHYRHNTYSAASVPRPYYL